MNWPVNFLLNFHFNLISLLRNLIVFYIMQCTVQHFHSILYNFKNSFSPFSLVNYYAIELGKCQNFVS